MGLEAYSVDSAASAVRDTVRTKGRPAKGEDAPKAEYRLQVKLTPAGKDRLDELVKRMHGDTAANIVRDALRVYDILTKEVVQDGGELILLEPNNDQPTKLRLW